MQFYCSFSWKFLLEKVSFVSSPILGRMSETIAIHSPLFANSDSSGKSMKINYKSGITHHRQICYPLKGKQQIFRKKWSQRIDFSWAAMATQSKGGGVELLVLCSASLRRKNLPLTAYPIHEMEHHQSCKEQSPSFDGTTFFLLVLLSLVDHTHKSLRTAHEE